MLRKAMKRGQGTERQRRNQDTPLPTGPPHLFVETRRHRTEVPPTQGSQLGLRDKTSRHKQALFCCPFKSRWITSPALSQILPFPPTQALGSPHLGQQGSGRGLSRYSQYKNILSVRMLKTIIKPTKSLSLCIITRY